MNKEILDEIIEKLRMIVALLVDGKYKQLEELSFGIRLKAEHIASGVSDYGRILVFPPDEAFSAIDVVEVTAGKFPEYSVRFPLYSKEEGRSDLSLEVSFIDENKGGQLRVEIDNITVF